MRDAKSVEQHPGVAEDVGLHVGQVEELGDTGVVGPAHLLVDLGGHRGALDLVEAVPAEEVGLEGQHEDPLAGADPAPRPAAAPTTRVPDTVTADLRV